MKHYDFPLASASSNYESPVPLSCVPADNTQPAEFWLNLNPSLLNLITRVLLARTHNNGRSKLFCLGFALSIMWACPVVAQAEFQLAPPVIRYESVFFEKNATVTLHFAQAGTSIRYTTNGQDPTERDPAYTQSLVLKKNRTTLKARVFGSGYLPSEVVKATFFKSGLPIKTALHSPPHERYNGSGNADLTDGKGGNTAHSHPTWLGFLRDTVTLHLTLAQPRRVRAVLLNVLQHEGAWIFLPQGIEYWGRKNGSKTWELMGRQTLKPLPDKNSPQCHPLWIDTLSKLKTDEIRVNIYPLDHIPQGHPGAGKPAWLFLDEVRVY